MLTVYVTQKNANLRELVVPDLEDLRLLLRLLDGASYVQQYKVLLPGKVVPPGSWGDNPKGKWVDKFDGEDD